MQKQSTKGKSKSQQKKKAPRQTKAQLEKEKKSRREVLAEKSDEELKDLYSTHFVKEPDENATREQIIEAIMDATFDEAAKALDPDDEDDKDRYTSTLENGEEVEIPTSITSQENWQDMVIVRQTPTRIVEGERVPLRGQAVIQGYTPEMFERLEDQKFFAESKTQIEFLNDPR